MSLQKLCKSFEQCNGKFAEVTIEGGVSIPYFIEKLEFEEGQETIYFGEEECENYPFIIYKDTIGNIEVLSEDNNEEIHLCFDVTNDGRTTKLCIHCDDVEVEYD